MYLIVRATMIFIEFLFFWKKVISEKKHYSEKMFLKKSIYKEIIILKKLLLFFKRKILRVEPGRAFTHMHRFSNVWGSRITWIHNSETIDNVLTRSLEVPLRGAFLHTLLEVTEFTERSRACNCSFT